MNRKPTLLILAAGMGSRYGGLKQIDEVGPNGETIMEYSIYSAIEAGFGKVVFVIRKAFEEAFKTRFSKKLEGKISLEYVFQEVNFPFEGIADFPQRTKPWGTGHAVLVADKAIRTPFAIINADDYYGKSGFQKMGDFLRRQCQPNHYSMVAYYLKNTLSDFGTVSRGICEMSATQKLLDVVEKTKIRKNDTYIYNKENEEKEKLTGEELVSMNFWGCHPSIFPFLRVQFQSFLKENIQSPKAEFYLPFAINELIQANKIQVSVIPNRDKWYGITYQEDKETVKEVFKNMG